MTEKRSTGSEVLPADTKRHTEMTRRGLLKAAGGGIAAAGATSGVLRVPSVTAAASRQQSVNITVTDAPGDEALDPIKENYQRVVERFKEVRPDVTVESHPGGFGGQDAFAAKVQGGTLENAFGVWFTEPQRLIRQGIVADITDQFKAWEHFGSFNPSVLEVVTDSNGRIFGIPTGVYALSLAYNRRLFEQAGLDPNTPPTTWDDARRAAKELSDKTDSAGFAFLSVDNQGGWHFTTLMYTYGGNPVEQQGGKWVATFNNEIGVNVLQLLKDMRWTDRSMTEEQLLNAAKVTEFLATDQVAMAVSGIPGTLQQYGADINDFGLGPVPQAGGNAVLGGGYAWMFNVDSTPEQIQAAIDWVLFRYFDLQNAEGGLKANAEAGGVIGFPEPPLFEGEMQAEFEALTAKYANTPTEFYAPYVEAMTTIEVRAEPSGIDVQKLYAAIDPVVQAVLTDENADPKQLLDQAAQQFQTQILDQAS